MVALGGAGPLQQADPAACCPEHHVLRLDVSEGGAIPRTGCYSVQPESPRMRSGILRGDSPAEANNISF